MQRKAHEVHENRKEPENQRKQHILSTKDGERREGDEGEKKRVRIGKRPETASGR